MSLTLQDLLDDPTFAVREPEDLVALLAAAGPDPGALAAAAAAWPGRLEAPPLGEVPPLDPDLVAAALAALAHPEVAARYPGWAERIGAAAAPVPERPADAVARWWGGDLLPGQARRVADRVLADPAWREAYRARLAEVVLTADARPGRLRLPHGPTLAWGPDAEGWRVRGPGVDQRIAPPANVSWGDAWTGQVTTRVEAAPLDAAEGLALAIHRVASGEPGPALDPARGALLSELAGGALHRALAEAAEADDDPEGAHRAMVALAVRAWAALDASRHADQAPELDRAFLAADAALRPHAGALGWLLDDELAGLAGLAGDDPDSWLGEFRAAQTLLDAPPEVRARLRGRLAPPPPRLPRAAERVAHAAGPAPVEAGVVRVLLVRDGVGLVRTLRIAHAEGARLSTDEAFTAVAAGAIRQGWLAAQRVAGGLARWDLEDHDVRVDHLPERVDGPSLGLAAGLAFLSLWAGHPLPDNVAATGVLGRDGAVGAAGGLEVKRAAALDLTVVDHAHPSLAAAWAAVGGRPVGPFEGDPARLLRRVQEWSDDVEQRDLRAHRLPGLGWLPLADKLAAAARRLGDGPRAGDVKRRGLLRAASAYLHAGDTKEAEALYAAAEALGVERTPAAALLAANHALGKALDAWENDPGADPEAHAWAADRALAELLAATDPARLAPVERRELGAGVGTRGRWRMHVGRPAEATPLFEEAIALHLRHRLPAEAARSRIYLGMALRAAGEPEGSLGALREALSGLDAAADDEARTALDASRVYAWHELARTQAALGRPTEALAAVERCLRLDPAEPYPLLGILRARAVALRLLGRPVDAVVAEMRRIAKDRRPDRLRIAEALGEPGPYGTY